MPSRRLPNSVPTAVHVLKTARDFYLLTALPADRAIDAATFAKLDATILASFLNRWLKELGDIGTAKAAGTTITDRLQPKKDRAALLISHFHQGLDRGITRGAFAPGARSYYARDAHDTRIPELYTTRTSPPPPRISRKARPTGRPPKARASYPWPCPARRKWKRRACSSRLNWT